ncbi:MAG: substrate-binding domain-containing protein [Chloroflexales bacterium]|nr:substrate-binding domain-containing protein [Chloroflexales bacterium]
MGACGTTSRRLARSITAPAPARRAGHRPALSERVAALHVRAGSQRQIVLVRRRVTGFDDIETAVHVTPALTTMRVDKAAMGRLAVQLLLNRHEAPASSPVTALLRPTLVERESVR